jgi:hypothetical protein
MPDLLVILGILGAVIAVVGGIVAAAHNTIQIREWWREKRGSISIDETSPGTAAGKTLNTLSFLFQPVYLIRNQSLVR